MRYRRESMFIEVAAWSMILIIAFAVLYVVWVFALTPLWGWIT